MEHYFHVLQNWPRFPRSLIVRNSTSFRKIQQINLWGLILTGLIGISIDGIFCNK